MTTGPGLGRDVNGDRPPQPLVLELDSGGPSMGITDCGLHHYGPPRSKHRDREMRR